VGVRELVVQTGPDEWVLMERDDGSTRRENLAIVDRVWLDEATGAFRWVHGEREDAEPVRLSVYDGRRASARYGSGAGPRLIRYEGAPEVVSRLAGWLSVDAARRHVSGTPIPGGMRVREPDRAGGEPIGDLFQLPSGGQAQLWRQVDRLESASYDRLYRPGERWNGKAADFAASLLHFDRGRRRAGVVVYPGLCVTTSERRPGDPAVGTTPVRLADGTEATAAVGRTRRDGSFAVRPPESSTTMGFVGYELALAGVGTHGLVVSTDRHTLVVTGTAIGTGAVADLAPLLRRAG
jgi:hypothetical protein